MAENFTAKQKEIVARKLGYDGPMQGFDDFLNSSPALGMKYASITDKFATRMAKGGAVTKKRKYAEGGVVTGGTTGTDPLTGAPIAPTATTYAAQQTTTPAGAIATQVGPTTQATTTQAGPAQTVTAPSEVTSTDVKASTSQGDIQAALAGQQAATGTLSGGAQVTSQQGTVSGAALATAPTAPTAATVAAPAALAATPDQLAKAATAADVGGPTVAQAQLTNKDFVAKAAQLGVTPQALAATGYQLGAANAAEIERTIVAQAAKAGPAEQATAAQAAAPEVVEAAQFTGTTPQAVAATQYQLDATRIADVTNTAVQQAAKAGVIPQAIVAQTAAQSTAIAVQREVTQKELVDLARDNLQLNEPVQAVAATMDKLNSAAVAIAQQGSFSQALATAQQGTVDAAATVAGQMDKLMQQFNDGTPAWAAGALRQANAAMAARGLGASSMAGAAIVQAAMEAATPIAAADAQTFAQMGLTNLNNRQQVSLANAAAMQNLELANLNAR